MTLLDLIFPRKCLSCAAFLGDFQDLCPPCGEKWPVISDPSCSRCSYPFRSREGDSHLCGDCLETENPSCRRIRAAGLYQGILHDLIVRLKYRKEERLARFLGRRMAETETELPDWILPVPLHRRRLRGRGFNQSLWLAREVGRVLERPVSPFLMFKTRETVPQAALRGKERRKNVKGAFAVARPGEVEGKRVLVVDDVYTTGATIEEVSRTLLRAGAESVEALVLARAV